LDDRANPASTPGVRKRTLRSPNVRFGPAPIQLLIQLVPSNTMPGVKLSGPETEHFHLLPRPSSWRPQRTLYLYYTYSSQPNHCSNYIIATITQTAELHNVTRIRSTLPCAACSFATANIQPRHRPKYNGMPTYLFASENSPPKGLARESGWARVPMSQTCPCVECHEPHLADSGLARQGLRWGSARRQLANGSYVCGRSQARLAYLHGHKHRQCEFCH